MSFPRYPKYKPSEVEWLGEVPTHWAARRLSSLARPGPGTFVDGDWVETPYITDAGVRLLQTGNVGIGTYVEQGFRFVADETLERLRCTEVLPGDVLICRLAEPVGRACLAPDLGTRMITSVDVCILKPGVDVHPPFLVHLLSSAQYLGYMEGQCRGGTRDRVSRSFLGSVRVTLPSLVEQISIACFLDCETARIDALVSGQERLIALLKDKRQAVIRHAMIKGLNPNAPTKPSGVEWIGKVPAHWNVLALKRVIADSKAGPFGSSLTKDQYVSDGYRVYGQEQVIPGDFSIGDYFIAADKYEELSQYAVKPGDILVSCVGTFGKVALVPESASPGIINPRLIRLRVAAGLYGEYLVELLRSGIAYEQLAANSRGGTMDVINIGTLEEILLPLPPSVEQIDLLAFINAKTIELDQLAADAHLAIDLLLERRAALISAAVTGQIDVRGLAREEAA